MKKLLFALSILVVTSCMNQNSKNSSSQNARSHYLDTLISGKRLIIKDTTQYSSFFVHELKEMSCYESLKLIDDSLIVCSIANTRPDSIVLKPFTSRNVFPTNLELSKEIRFSTKLQEKNFNLILKRTNFTNIGYQLKQNGKTIKSGTAILQASFFFGAENMPDENGEQIFLNQYIDKKGFHSYILVDITKAERAAVTYCPDGKTEKYETLPIFIRE